MYSVHSYYWAVLCQVLSALWIYPVLLTLISFYCFEFEYRAITDLLMYMAALLCITLTGAFMGLSMGCFTDDQNVAILLANLVITLANFGAGCLANTGSGANPVIKFLSWISPMHYGVEIVFKITTKGRSN